MPDRRPPYSASSMTTEVSPGQNTRTLLAPSATARCPTSIRSTLAPDDHGAPRSLAAPRDALLAYLFSVTWPVCVAKAEIVPTHAAVHVELTVPDSELAVTVIGPFAVIEQVGMPGTAPAGTVMVTAN